MPVYDFSGGLGLLGRGIDSLGASLKTANQQTQATALATALANGDWDGAMQAAARAGDTNTVLKLRELRQSGDQANAFNSQLPQAIKALYPGGLGGTGTATDGAAGNPPNYDPASIEGKIRAKAQQLGIDPDIAVRVYGSEGRAGYQGDYDAAGNPTSFGPFQMHYRTGGGGMGNVSGMGDQFTTATGKNARDASTVDDQIDFALRQAKQHGWGQWYGAAKVGISPWQGINATTARSEAAAPVAIAGGNRPSDTATASGALPPMPAMVSGVTGGPARSAVAPVSEADVPAPGAAPASGTYPQLVSNAPLPPIRPAGLGDSLAPAQPPPDPALLQFLASHTGGPDVASRLLQAPPNTPTGSIVPPGLLPHDDAVKPAGQFIAEAKQALAGGMAHGAPQTLAPTLAPPAAAAPAAVPGLNPADAMGAPVIPPQAAAAVPPGPSPYEQSPGTVADTYAGLNPVRASYYRSRGLGPDGQPLPAPAAAAAPVVAPAPAPAAAPSAPPDIAAIERSMPAVQQQAASVGGGQVNDAGMAAASALTSGQPVPQGLGASLQAPVMQALSQGGAPAALTQGPPPAAAPPPPTAAALPPSVAVDASGSTPPPEAPGAAAATPPAAAPSIASPANPDPPVMIGGRMWTREQASNTDAADSPSVAAVARAQGIKGEIDEKDGSAKDVTDGLKDGSLTYGGAGAASPPIDAKLPPTPAAVKAGDPVVTAAAPVSPAVARSLAQTRPGSDQRMMLFALLMRGAANSGPQSAGNVKFVEALMGIEKQHQEDFGKTLRTVSDAELASLGYTKAPGSVVQADPWGNLKVTPPGAEPAGHIMSDAEVAANRLSPVTGTGRVWWQPGKPGEKPVAIDANTETSKVVPITEEQKKLYQGAVGMYVGGKEDGKPFYPPGPLVKMEAQGEFEKVYEHAKGDIVAADMAAGNTANRRIQALSILKDASDAGGNDISSGPFGETALKIKQALAEFGIDIPAGMAPAEVAKKVGFDFATQMVKAISSRPGQQEFVRALGNVPGLEMSRPGRDAMISILTQEAANDQKLALLAQDPENAKKWAMVKRDFYNDPANAIMSPFRRGPNGEPVPISKADVFIMAERAGMKPPPEPKPIPPGFKSGKFGPTITDISQMKGTFDRGTPVTLPDGTPGWTQ